MMIGRGIGKIHKVAIKTKQKEKKKHVHGWLRRGVAGRLISLSAPSVIPCTVSAVSVAQLERRTAAAASTMTFLGSRRRARID